jgi:O-acetyl-ADP-ribose deacetylase (regulator of RNase III)
MIEHATGNLIKADAEALVNTVNCKGFMGKGIALQFKQAYPANFEAYARACKQGEVQPGRMFIHRTGMMMNPRYIINFPTKRHWRGRSRMEDIDAGLVSLIEDVQRLGIVSIAVPPLGCGNGGLAWAKVRPKIVAAFTALPDVRVLLFDPHGAPEAKSMPVRTERPKMTTARALFVMLMQQYRSLDYRLTLLEIQKLAYFLQEAGEQLRLRYEAGHYGPYAANLNKVLERTEGHFTRGYGDSQKPDVEIDLMPGATEEAERFLAERPESRARLARVAALIEGFETPYGMELLASVHWVAAREPGVTGPDEAVTRVHAWNARKRDMFRAAHIRVAWARLTEAEWLAGNA